MDVFCNWSQYKDLCITKRLVMNYTEDDMTYHLFSVELNINYLCELYKTNEIEITDFETNYKANSNLPIRKQEREQARPQMLRGSVIATNGQGTLLLKVPGTVGVDKRYLKGGFGWFSNPVEGDNVKVYVSDEDNIMGAGAGYVVASINDDQAPVNNQGWFIPKHKPIIKIEGFEDYMELVSGLYIKLVVAKGDNTTDTFYANIYAGSRRLLL